MSKLNTSILFIHLALMLSTLAFADDDTVRYIKKKMNRVEEALCMEGDLKCAVKKAGNRLEETKDSAVDGVKKIKKKLE